ncbi:hypothetical protein ALC53_08152 [Atta colombica]|uniref:Uncharacterized protein n=1 Tax=Atta colombica TaxID=520822 RepID=A0A195BB16_9HYME|nr:hypothetical protein ALC53_08152 [Atta colombica]
MTCGRWTNAIGSKGAPAFPPPYAPPSILVRLKRRFQSSRSDRAHAHAFAASTAIPGVCTRIRRRAVPKSLIAIIFERTLSRFTLYTSVDFHRDSVRNSKGKTNHIKELHNSCKAAFFAERSQNVQD